MEECCDQVLILKDGNIAAFCNLEEERRANLPIPGNRNPRREQRQLPRGHRSPGLPDRHRRAGPHQADPARWHRGAPALRSRRRAGRADPPPEAQARFARRHFPEGHGRAAMEGSPMAVYKKTYRPYEGALTASATRLFVITRYAMEDLRRSKFLNIVLRAQLRLSADVRAAHLSRAQHQRAATDQLGGGPGEGRRRARAGAHHQHQPRLLLQSARMAEHAGAVPRRLHRPRA